MSNAGLRFQQRHHMDRNVVNTQPFLRSETPPDPSGRLKNRWNCVLSVGMADIEQTLDTSESIQHHGSHYLPIQNRAGRVESLKSPMSGVIDEVLDHPPHGNRGGIIHPESNHKRSRCTAVVAPP